MTLKDLARVLAVYTTIYVHDRGDRFACQGHPHQFVTGEYKSHGDDTVEVVSAIAPYSVEVTVGGE